MAQTYPPEKLEAFVSKEVASLCDADPTVLAQYVVAIIGAEQPNDSLKERLQNQLSEFFDGQTVPFIDRLFAKMKSADTQSNAAPSSSTSNAAAGRFNEFSDDEDDGDRNFKHRRQRSNSRDDQDRGSSKRRLDQEDQNGSSSKYLRSADNRRSNNNPNSIPVAGNGYNGQYDNNRGRGAGYRGGRGGRGGSNMNRSGGRPQCRDYNEKGFCMRGDMCPYDHGLDRVVVEGNTGPFPGTFPPGGPIPPMGVRTVPPQNFFGGMPGAVPDAYDPERSGLMPNNDMVGGFPNMPPMMNPNDMMMNNGMIRGNGMRRGGAQRGRGGRGGFQGSHRHHHNSNPQNTTLNVEKIPIEHCQIATVNDYFAKFGTITNISVQPHAQKAVIQYSTRAEAEAAYNSPDVIFDNRFVKVYWHKEDTPATDAAAAAAAPAVSTPPKSNEPDPELVAARAAELAKEREEKQKKHKEHLQWILDFNRRKETQLQQQIDEQKRLLTKLTDSADMSAAEKAELLKALKNIQKDIDNSKSAASQPIPPPGQSSSTAQPAAAATAATEEKKSGPETTEELAKKLARLEAEAANLGIHAPGFRGGRGGYYGRGRGSYPRVLRGGMAPRMTLDNRPTKIVAKDIPQDSTETELRQHFEQFGNVTSYEQKENEALVQYGARFEAEKAMAAGPNYSKGKLALAWFTDSKPNTLSTTTEES